jgi:ribosomal protein S18 acetylase RimI-like enzyme
MFVKTQYRGKGVFQALLDELLKDFNTEKIFFLSANGSLAHNAKKLYLRNGFEIIDKESLPIGFPYFL